MLYSKIIQSVRCFVADKCGSIAVLSAAFMMVAIGALALAVDVGALYVERRSMQGAVDLAAIAGASDIPNAEAAVAATLKANGVVSAFTVVRGRYTPDSSISHSDRFKPGQSPYNAIRVLLDKLGQLYFAKAFTSKPIEIGVAATAANADLAAFSVGSRLLAVRDGLANKLLTSLTGSMISLSVMDYKALIDADISLFAFLDALATKVELTGGTYNDVLNAYVTLGNVVAAAAAVTEKNGDTVATAALKTLLSQGGSLNKRVPLASFINLGPLGNLRIGDPAPGLDSKFSAMEFVSGSAVLANGKNQVAVDLGAQVPGLLSLKLELAIGEPPQETPLAAVGALGSGVRTAQTRLKIVAEIGGAGALLGTTVRLPIYLELAYGEGRLAGVSCTSSSGPTAMIAARSGIAELWIGEITTGFTDFINKPVVSQATLVNTSLIKIRGRAHVDAGSMTETMLTFTSDDVANATILRTSTNSLVQSVVTSLLKDLQLNVQVVGLGLALPGALTSAVLTTLSPVAKPLDDVIFGLLTTLGIHLGEADVRVRGVRCGSGILAG